ncbi:MAG: WYL domain-containing transcriptional regulator [Elusimicrobia bacterium]|nr:WYL domain-containing transcriptional regulator [Elusimicrobiota bacterium]
MASKRGEGDRKHYRIGKILNLLDSGPVRINDLALEFDVTTRSIERDFERIELYGYEVETPCKGVKQFAPGVSLKKSKLTADQHSALIMLHEMSKNLGASVNKSFSSLFKHLTESEPWESNILPLMPRLIKTETIPYIKEIEEAIDYGRKLKMTYCSRGKTEADIRVVCPLKILIADGFAYILTVPGDGKGRAATYRIDRIKSLEVLPDGFTAPADVEKIIRKARNIWGVMPEKHRRIQVRLKVERWAVDYFRQQEIVGGQKTRDEKDGSLTFEAKVCEHREIIPHILRWIPNVTILEPPELKAEVRSLVERYLKK